MNNSPVRPEELTQEKGLWAVWWAARVLPTPRRKYTLPACLAIAVLHAAMIWKSPLSGADLAEQLRSFVQFVFTYAITMLGFALAGFTIFATVSREDFLVELAKHREPKTDLPWLKYIFFHFTDVFVGLLVLTGLSLLLYLASPKGGLGARLVSVAAESLSVTALTCKSVLIVAADMLLVFLFCLSIVSVWYFVFNVYHVVMMTQRWHLEKEEQERSQATKAAASAPTPSGEKR